MFALSPRSWQDVQAAEDVDQLGQEQSLFCYGVGRIVIVCFFWQAFGFLLCVLVLCDPSHISCSCADFMLSGFCRIRVPLGVLSFSLR